MKLLYCSLAFFLSLPSLSLGAAEPADPTSTAAPSNPCTIKSPKSGSFFNLNPLHIVDPAISGASNARNYSWNTTGFELPYNFTLNFCGGVVEDLSKLGDGGGVEGVEEKNWKNVSAFYEHQGKVYSIG